METKLHFSNKAYVPIICDADECWVKLRTEVRLFLILGELHYVKPLVLLHAN